MVTLATELACVIAYLLYSNLIKGWSGHELENYLEILGGTKFQEKKRKLKNLVKKRDDIVMLANTQESRLVRQGSVEIIHNSGIKGAIERIDGGYLLRTKRQFFAEEADKKWAEYKDLFHQYKKALLIINKLSACLECDRATFFEGPDFDRGFREHLEKREMVKKVKKVKKKNKDMPIELSHIGTTGGGIVAVPLPIETPRANLECDNPIGREKWYYKKRITVDFDANNDILKGGASYMLSQTDAKWWRHFVTRITKEIDTTANSGPLRIMLRDLGIAELVNKHPDKRVITKNDVLIDNLNNLESSGGLEWPNCKARGKDKITITALRQAQTTVRKEDREAKIWMNQKGGNFHPCNFYLMGSEAKSGDEKVMQKYKEYPQEQAANELYWCLCRDSDVTFTPVLSNKYPESKWNDWVVNAEAGKSNYWNRDNT